eukprot:scaffold69605_cov63-Phaeocystis_antarctica.AAC.2
MTRAGCAALASPMGSSSLLTTVRLPSGGTLRRAHTRTLCACTHTALTRPALAPFGSCGLRAAVAVERLLRSFLPTHICLPHRLDAGCDLTHAYHADRPWRRARRVLARPPAARGEGRVAAHVQQMQRLQAAARAPLLPV